jgi:hypothetical protein
MRCVIALAAVGCALSACANEADEAEERYLIVKRHGTLGDVCDAATEVANAHLRNHNEREYRVAVARAGLDCNRAAMDGRSAPAQDDVRQAAEAAADALEIQATGNGN